MFQISISPWEFLSCGFKCDKWQNFSGLAMQPSMSAPIDVKLKVRSPDERPLSWARYPGPTVPHVAISREERDLAHAGYEVHVLSPQPAGQSNIVHTRVRVSSGKWLTLGG